jgi:TolA-binding protein
MANFGKIMAIILFVVAGLVLIFSFSGGMWKGNAMGCGMCSGPFQGGGKGKMGMSWTSQKDIQKEIDELSDQVDDLEQRVNEMPVFVQDLVKQTVERMQKEGNK